MIAFLLKLAPIFIILAVFALVIWRMPKVEIEHSKAFEARRRMNWIFLGLTYAFLYFGRYNLAVAKDFLGPLNIMTNEMYGEIYSIGAVVYGCSVVLNAPLCDKFGGRKTLMIGAIGSSIINLIMGIYLFNYDAIMAASGGMASVRAVFIPLYAINMYFQSFGAISIVKVNSAWFHVRERGMIGGIFGALISLGLYFAYDWNTLIAQHIGIPHMFVIPAGVLFVMFLVTIFIIRDTPKDAGFEDLNTGDATSNDTGPRAPVLVILKKIITNPIILTIACIEFCSGYTRDGIMQWGKTAGKYMDIHKGEFIFENWGMVSCCAGIIAGMMAGLISDYVFKSRRGPVAAILYGGLIVFCTALFFVLDNALLGIVFACMTLCVIGVHGMLSGTASMDFGGSKNAGIATGIIDGFAYLGSATSGYLLGKFLPNPIEGDDASIAYANDPGNWEVWPMLLMPAIVLGFILCTRIWNAKVDNKKKAPSEERPAENSKDKAEEKSDDKAEEKSDDKAEEKSDDKAEEKSDDKAEEKSEEKPE